MKVKEAWFGKVYPQKTETHIYAFHIKIPWTICKENHNMHGQNILPACRALVLPGVSYLGQIRI